MLRWRHLKMTGEPIIVGSTKLQLDVRGFVVGDVDSYGVAHMKSMASHWSFQEDGQPAPVTEPERARDDAGAFAPDDPATPDVNEAWVGGEPPAKEPATPAPKKRGRKARKKAE